MLSAMKPGCCLLFLFLACRLVAADSVTVPKSSPSTNARVSVVAPQPDVTKAFQIKPGFRLELVAAEPIVTAPVAMAFDENGRMYVLEQPGVSGGPGPAQGRIRLLEDSDGNGIYNASSVYADNLPNASAIVCYGGGVFVAAAGEILFLKDSNGNGIADVRREVFKSFGDPTNGANGQVVITSLAWGLDNRIHAATMSQGGDVISSSAPSQSMVLREGGFSFDPRTFQLAAEGGSGASGMCFDDRGRKFICKPGSDAEVVMYSVRYEVANPFFEGLPPAAWPLGPGPARLIYPVASAGYTVPPPIHFTAARGISVYRGNAFPREYEGDIFVADSAANILHHIKLVRSGAEVTSVRPGDEAMIEFVAGRDNSFQPMDIENAPDGTLYFAGLSSEPTVSALAKNNAIPSGGAHGRIYRIVPIGFKQPKLPSMPKMPAEELVSMLKHPNGWHRDTAARLIFERQDRATTGPLVRMLFDMQAPPLARMHALHALDGIELMMPGRSVPTRALLESHLSRALVDPDERVREQAVLLSEKFVSKAGTWSDALWSQLGKLGGDPSPLVRYQLALTLGQGQYPGRAQALAQIARADPKACYAVLSSLKEGAAEVFVSVAGDARLRNDALGQSLFFPGLISIVAKENQPGDATRVVAALQNVGEPKLAFSFARLIEINFEKNDAVLQSVVAPDVLKQLSMRALAVAGNMNADNDARADAMRFLSTQGAPDSTLEVGLFRNWQYLKPSLQNEFIEAFLSRPEWTVTLVNAMETGLISRAQLTLTQIRFLLGYPDETLRQHAAMLFGNWPGLQRQTVVNRYQAALQMAGNAERGRKVFENNLCVACHQTADEPSYGAFAYNLTDAAKPGKQAMLIKILDPNRIASRSYPLVALQTKTGEIMPGFVGRQNQKSSTFLQPDGTTRYIARSNETGETSVGGSGMPEGWETTLSVQDMADLLEYLTAKH